MSDYNHPNGYALQAHYYGKMVKVLWVEFDFDVATARFIKEQPTLPYTDGIKSYSFGVFQ